MKQSINHLGQDFTVAMKAPGANHNEGFIYFTAFIKASSGALIAFAAIEQSESAIAAGQKGHRGKILLSRSTDGGLTWTLLDSKINFERRIMGGQLFAHGEALYMFVSFHTDDGSIVAMRSDDEGVTWSTPVEVIKLPSRIAASGSKSESRTTLKDDPNWAEGQRWFAYCQNAMVVKNGRLYFAVSERTQNVALVSCDIAKGVMNPGSWFISDPVPVTVPKELSAGLFPGFSMGTLEANVIEINGQLRVLARQVVDRYGTSNIATVFDVEEVGEEQSLHFRQMFPIPGAHGKFDIVYDAPSQLFWMATNLESNSQNWVTHPTGCHAGRDRRFLTLWYALDALNWFPAGHIASAKRMGQTFNYPCMIVDGENLGVLSRTTLDADNYTSHDADTVTFHSIPNFRALALDIRPIP